MPEPLYVGEAKKAGPLLTLPFVDKQIRAIKSGSAPLVLFAQGRDLSGQRPDETNAVCRCAGNEAVVPTVRHSV